MNLLPMPPKLTGTLPEQLQQLWDYLYCLIERINALSGDL